MSPDLALVAALASLLAVIFAALAALKGWQGWLELRREALLSGGTSRGDVAELKRRIRKLEAIASGID